MPSSPRRLEKEDLAAPPGSWRATIQSWFQQQATHFAALQGSPRQIWVIFMLKLLESYAYFASAAVHSIFLSDEFGMSDREAGIAMGAKGLCASVYGIALGWVVDRIGVRRSLLWGCSLSLLGRITISVASSKGLLYFCFYVLLPLGGCFTIPWLLYFCFYLLLPFGACFTIKVLTLAIKGCTSVANRGYAFGVFYSIMNVGVFISGLAVDLISTRPAGPRAYSSFDTGDVNALYYMSGNRLVFASAAGASVVMLITIMIALPDTPISGRGAYAAPGSASPNIENADWEDRSVGGAMGASFKTTSSGSLDG
ncbi:hypothetical protein T484DRAFT_1897763, partial [Baffinella frigidus]